MTISPNRLLSIHLLGGFSLHYGDQPVDAVNTPRLQSLLAYLVLHADIPQARHHIAFLLWPDASEANARNSLRQFLYQLRQALPNVDHYLSSDANVLCWHSNDDQSIDVQQFEMALAQAAAGEQSGDWGNVRTRLNEALSIYRGELLPGCYDDWITPQRERLQDEYRRAYQKLVRILEEQRDYGAALQAAQALLRLDPLADDAYITLMRLHSLNHDHPAARRVYLSAVETLMQELGVEPGQALQRAYERLQRIPDEYAASSLTLVGRQKEWQQLQMAWTRAAAGNANLTLIVGEAGIGKSRLAEELFTWAQRQHFTVARTRSYAAEGRLSLAPVTEWLRSAGLRPHMAKLDAAWLMELTRLLPELLDEYTDLARPNPITEYGERQHFFEALARVVLAAPRPILLWIDDLQWCDLETLEWLHFLLRFEPRLDLLILGTARSEESPPDHPLTSLARQLRAEDRLSTVELKSLDASETAHLAALVEARNWDTDSILRLYRETEGNPLFIVETVRAGVIGDATSGEMGVRESILLPPRVYAVIAGRLAQLSPKARKVAELGAVIGRAFSVDLLCLAGQDDEEATVQALDELWQRRIVREHGTNLFDFTHDKLRDVAYAEINVPQRRLLHRRIAQALETLHADNLDPVSAQIAAHYEQAGLFELALPNYQRAGDRAAGVYANDDAIELLTRALTLLPHLPQGAKRDSRELSIQLALATLYRIAKGWASPEVERVMNRLMVLSAKVGTDEQRISTLFGMQTLYVVQARYEKVESAYAEAERLYMQTRGTAPPLFAGISLTGAKQHMGRLVESRDLFERMIAARETKPILDLRESQGMNYLVHGLAWNAHGLWSLGDVQQALDSAAAAVEAAREFADPFNQALSVTYQAQLLEWAGEPDVFRAHAEYAVRLTEENKAPYYHAWSNILLNFAAAEQEPSVANLLHLREALQTFTDSGAHIRLSIFYSLLARVCLLAGRLDEATEAIELGLTESLQNNERFWDAELHRLRGELRLVQDAEPDEVEGVFQRSIEIAQSQQAKSLELRAATSLARLWSANARNEAAKRLLLPVYNQFTEGIDTPDLWAARALLDDLSKSDSD
ncbi:MAG: AAA family ATPase [Chloroflexi bacterium]|nr:AAA family ATPase [Chloroflexota bacterium]